VEEMKLISSLAILFIVLTFTACETIVDIEIPDQDTKLVCNAIAVAGDSVNIFRLTKSRGVLEPFSYYYEAVEDGEIVLLENDIPVATLHQEFNPGDYPCHYPFHSGNTYTIEASADGLTSVNASTVLPFGVVPVITSYTPNVYTDQNGTEIAELKFTLNDPASEENYYTLLINGINNYGSQDIYFNSNDPALNITSSDNGNGGFSGENQTSFDDHLFNGQSRTFTINLISYDVSSDFKLEVKLISLDRPAYLYSQSKRLQDVTNGNPFAEPVQVYNNIENGYGIFGSMTIERDTIQ